MGQIFSEQLLQAATSFRLTRVVSIMIAVVTSLSGKDYHTVGVRYTSSSRFI